MLPYLAKTWQRVPIMKNVRIFTKVFLSHAVIGFFSVILSSFIFYFILRDALIQRTIDQLSSINILKKNQVENYFMRTQKDLEFLLAHDLFLQHLDALRGDSSAAELQKFKQELEDIRTLYDFDDIMIVNETGRPLWRASDDLFLVKDLFPLPKNCNDKFCVLDASRELPAKETVLLYSLPLTRGGESPELYMVIRDHFQKIQRLLQETTGMGTTGESYLVGRDFYMRSSSRFFPGRPPLEIEVKTKASVGSFTHHPDDHIILDYRGQKVLSFYRSLDLTSIQWTLISEIDFDEAMRPVVKLRNYFIGITFVLIAIILMITLLISNVISKPILSLRNVIISLSRGIIPEKSPRISNTDEIGQIADAIDQLIQGMKRTTAFAYELGSGNFDASFTSLSEHDTLGLALMHMRDQLKSLNEREVRLVREKAAAMLEGQENERRRIIQELHDGVGQLLTAIRLRVEMLDSDEALRKEIMTLINDTIAEVKRISYNVMPNAIVDFGLKAALRGLCENIKKYTNLTFDFKYVKEVEQKLNFDVTIAVFRIVQEGLNNIIKHAGATHVVLHVLEKEDEIYLVLKDNGRGIDAQQINLKTGTGLRSMQERAKLLNGNLEIYADDGKGTVIEMHIPLHAHEKD